jgi:hypothetical protein
MALLSKFASAGRLKAVALGLSLLATYPSVAQGPMSSQEIAAAEGNSHTLGARMYAAAHEATASMGSAPDPADSSAPADDQWHLAFMPYLWFPGMHGTAGVAGYKVGVKASPGDLLSHFDIGLMGTVQARKNHFVLPIDFMWVALSDDKGLPENTAGVESISARTGQFFLTPKAGYQIMDTEKWKVDSLVGLRYWHLGQRFHFNPMIQNDVTTSQNWVDAVAGARIERVLSPKASVVVLGDAGGGGAVPDYQVAGLLSFKVKKSIALVAGWRYLDVHYRSSDRLFVYDMTESGVGLGAVFSFK